MEKLVATSEAVRESGHAIVPLENGIVASLTDTESIPMENGAIRNATTGARLSELQPHHHSSLFFLSLIEARCRTQAANSLNANRSPESRLAENHPEVHELSCHLFQEMSRELRTAGVLSSGQEFTGPEVANLRAQYLNGFDTAASAAAATIHQFGPSNKQDSSSMSIKNERFDMINTLATIPFNTLALEKREFALLPYKMANRHPIYDSMMGLSGQEGYKSTFLAEYQQLEFIGRGAFGHVQKVRNVLDNGTFAIKQIRIPASTFASAAKQNQLKGLLAEVQAHTRLSHPNVARYFHTWLEPDVGQTTSQKNEQGLLSFGEALEPSSTAAGDTVSLRSAGEDTAGTMRKRLEESVKKGVHEGQKGRSRSLDIIFGSSPGSQTGRISTPSSSGDSDETGVEEDVEEVPRNRSDIGDESQAFDSAYLDSTPLPKTDIVHFIKMAYYPLDLYRFIKSATPSYNMESTHSHCFHEAPSIKILASILNGLQYIHSKGIVHRDIKPQNILLAIEDAPYSKESSVLVSACPDCNHNGKDLWIIPCIADFGLIAEPKSSGINPSLGPVYRGAGNSPSSPTRHIGTTMYMPDTMPLENSICPKLDVYSLGIVACELIHKFDSAFERVRVLTDLKNGFLPSKYENHRMAEGILMMVCEDRDIRWDTATVREWTDKVIKDLETTKL